MLQVSLADVLLSGLIYSHIDLSAFRIKTLTYDIGQANYSSLVSYGSKNIAYAQIKLSNLLKKEHAYKSVLIMF